MSSELLQTFDAVATAVEAGVSEHDRKALLQTCNKLIAKLESAPDTATRLLFSAHQAMAIRLGVDLKLFDALAQGSATAERLTAETNKNADPLLVTRIMRFLSAMSVVKETEQDKYALTPFAAALQSSSPLSAAVIHSTHFLTVLSKLPEYFHHNGWKSPDDGFNGPFQYAMGTDAHYFDFLNTHPYYQQAFNTVMSLPFRRRGKDWFEFFPVTERLHMPGESDVLIVDVGGSQGEDLKKLKKRFPGLSGRLIVQDLPGVVEGAQDMPPGIEAHGHDFFQQQPICNSRAYFMRTVLHDWPDKQALLILRRLHEAMGSDSLLLINEAMLPEFGAPLGSVLSDMQMMGSFASLERTERQWQQLLEASGFDLVRVWLPDGSQTDHAVLFEARRKA
ncbi:uncharacterized protein PFLUO_LOCUS7025 [Penicillium psychrofluorescens]|uniref:uncharacterized protein n=1 Tax=Penicillium psychrofluorescens TaxID=3158075 RepID=UPI003CCE40DF